MSYLGFKMLGNNFPEPIVQPLSMFMQNHGVSITVQFLKAQTGVVLLLDLLNGILQQVPYVVHISLVHSHLDEKNLIFNERVSRRKDMKITTYGECTDSHFAFFFGTTTKTTFHHREKTRLLIEHW